MSQGSRPRRFAASVALAVALVVVVPTAAQAAATLSLTPNHGVPTASFTATYTLTVVECFSAGESVAFFWDSGRLPYATATLDDGCTASATAPPPSSGATVGVHSVRGRYCSGACQFATATYTIDTPPPTTTTTTTAPPATAPATAPAAPPPAPPPPPTTRPPTTPTTTTTTTTAPTTTTLAPTTPTTTSTTTTATALPPTAPTGTTLTPATTTTTVALAAPPEPGSPQDHGGSTPAFVAAVPGPQDVDATLAVILTNLLLAFLLLLLFGATSAVFNSTLEANRDTIEGWFGRWRVRFGRVGQWFGGQGSARLRLLAILALTGVIYGFLSPGFGFDRSGIILMVSLMIGIGALTWVGEGGAAWFTRSRLHVPAAVKVHSAALLAAVACVAVTRALDFRPGIVYGFVASTAFLVPAALDRKQSGRAAFYPTVMLLMAGVAAWLGLGLVRAAEFGGWGADLAEAVLAVFFIGAIEGVLYNMLPLVFMDGRAILEWSRAAWAGLFGVSAFAFLQLVINPDASWGDVFGETGVRVVLSLAAAFVAVTAATWFYFRIRAAEAATAG